MSDVRHVDGNAVAGLLVVRIASATLERGARDSDTDA